MKTENVTYTCSICNSSKKLQKGKPAPLCCDREMKPEPIPFCTTAPHTEMARNSENDEPCDDNRSNKG